MATSQSLPPQSEGKKTYKFVTVNTAPEKAKIIIGRVVEALRDRYVVDYIGNTETEFVRFVSFPDFDHLMEWDVMEYRITVYQIISI
jgi:hypothetical protein